MLKHKNGFILALLALILTSLACGSVQVGVVTPTNEVEPVAAVDVQNPEPEGAAPTEELSQPEDETTFSQPVVEDSEPVSTETITAWLGHIVSLPGDSQYDDMVVLSPDNTGELGLAGATHEIENEIHSLRDAEGPNEYVYLWGVLSCNVDDYNGCQILVDKLQYGANYSEEEVVDWVGTIKSSTFNGGTSTIFELPGQFPMWYSIHASQDEALQAEMASLRDTGAVVQVSGKLLVGIPDVNGTRIEVSSLSVVSPGTQGQTALDEAFSPPSDWPVFANERYGYQFSYPPEATITLHGPVSFSNDDLPTDMTPEQYMDELLTTYTDYLCVQVDYSLGTIYISAPPNTEKFYTPCGPTGVGSGEVINKVESVYVGGQLFEANGMEIKLEVSDGSGGVTRGETLDMHSEMYFVLLDDNTRIFFGSVPHFDATYNDYLMKTREMLLQIISTYQVVP